MQPGLDVVPVSHLALLLGLALEGRGIAWVPESVVRHELSAGVLVEAGAPKWSIPMEIRLFRPFSRLGAAAEDFWTYVVQGHEPGRDDAQTLNRSTGLISNG